MSLFLTSFIFEKKEYDDDFYQLDGEIERYTQSLEGFIGMESYHDAASGESSTTTTGATDSLWK